MAGSEQPPRSVWSNVVEIASVLGPPATVVTALVIYFGWARAEAQARYMSLHVNLFEYTPRDFALLSISALYVPLLCLTAVALLWVWLDRALRARIDRSATGALMKALPRVGLAGAGVLTALMLILIFVEAPYSQLYAPYLIALAVLIGAWSIRIQRYARTDALERTVEQRAVEMTLVLALVTLLMFWGTTTFAAARGRGQAEMLERSLPWTPAVQIYSRQDLGITVQGVTVHRLGTEADPLYRYDGLRLLSVSGGRYFFLHDGWTLEQGTVVVLPDDDTLRLQYQRRTSPE
ncbi:hypothetical protein [Kocuria sabuli]|uniref:hypothetical protein n=1 Tax=Kocuria sabuli TaxID=3071448 RepID=UPI0034D5C3B4